MNQINSRRLGLVVLLAALVLSLVYFPVAEWIARLVEWARIHPVGGPLAYIAFVIVATIIFLPGSVLTMIGGFLFGFWPGVLFAAVAIPLGAQCAFEVARWAARPWVRKSLSQSTKMQAIEGALRETAFLVVALTRLSLIIPFNLLNYAYGATSVRAHIHFAATAIGMLPAIGLYVYLGSLARDLGEILSGNAAPPELGYWLLGVGIVVIAIISWVIHRAAKRTLDKHLAIPAEAGPTP